MTIEPVRSLCPLCQSRKVRHFADVRDSKYFRCGNCKLTHLAPEQRLEPLKELERYKLHRNDPFDERYRSFLRRLSGPLMERLHAGATGLDYGCGPAPTLSRIFHEKNYQMSDYDPFFAPHENVLSCTYDFITCCETVEHFHHPGAEFQKLNLMLRPHGWLGVMTQIQEDDRAFADWHYLRDPTHVSFYHNQTMEWIALEHGWKMDSPRKNVVLFYKPPPSAAPM